MEVSLNQDGFEIINDALDDRIVDQLIAAVEKASAGRDSAGIRQPHISIREIGEAISLPAIRGLVEPALGSAARVVRSILFDKTAARNWSVPWHQDLTIAVAERRDAPGFIGWSMKDGVNCVQAPREVLERMLTVRVHLDDCGVEMGPLRVLPGTHLQGWLSPEQVDRFKREVSERTCVVRQGGVVLMRPLLLHASSRAVKLGHRRVLHLEFAAVELPSGLHFSCG